MNSKRIQRLKNLAEKFKHQRNLMPNSVNIVEVGPRDGLQNEAKIIPAEEKIGLINALSKIGFKSIECTSFVSPKWIPQMADSSEVYSKIEKLSGINYPALVPNIKGMETALKLGVKEIAVFAGATESFSKKNINCSIEESFKKFKEVIDMAKSNEIKVRGYVSCVMGCPYEGEVDPKQVEKVASALYTMGCYEISLGDTIGAGTPEKTNRLFTAMNSVPKEKLAAHFHDTFGNAVENILTALTHGISVVDSSIGGLGGCPYAKKKAGNVRTEDVAYALDFLGIEHGLDIQKLENLAHDISLKLERNLEM